MSTVAAPAGWRPAPIPENEAARLESLRGYGILDTPPEPGFDRLAGLAARIFDAPIAMVSLVDEGRQWFKSCVGLEIRETERAVAFCAHAILSSETLVVEDALEDARFAANPLVLGIPHVRFYAGAPLRTADGFHLGTLCVVDRRPRAMGREKVAILEDLACLVVGQLELRRAYRSRLLFEKVADASPDVIFVFDLLERRATYSNREMAAILGFEASGAGLDTIFAHLHPDDRPRVMAHRKEILRLADGEKSEIVYRVMRADGGCRWFRSRETVFTRDPDGGVREMLAIATDITGLKEAEERASELAVTDELTGLPNRRGFRERLSLLLAEAGRGRRFALVVADVDRFKAVNDAYGHSTGDRVLVALARTLKSQVRRTDLVARYGGEEFAILLTDVDEDRAAGLVEKVRAAVANLNDPLPITCSFGVSGSASGRQQDGDALIAAADAALYEAKAAGRNRVVRAGDLRADGPAAAAGR